MAKIVPFHEFGRRYLWNVASGEVTNNKGEVVARNCWTLEAARVKVKHR